MKRSTNWRLTLIHSSAYDKIVFIYVSPDNVSFGMHQRLLRQASAFFKNAFDGKIEREEDVDITHPDDASKGIALTNEDPKIFKQSNDWLYTHRLSTGDEKAIDLPKSLIVDTYVFAEKRGIPRLQNTCIDAAIKKRKTVAFFPARK